MRSVVKIFLLTSGFYILITACSKEEDNLNDFERLMELPSGFSAIQEPSDNVANYDRWLLGKTLFYDPILSRDSSISCASCHKLSLAFADNIAISPGVDDVEGSRNSPSLANVAYQPYLMREGGVPSLEAQVLVPIQEHAEMDFNIVAAGERLSQIKKYQELSMAAYNREPDYYIISYALACFERTIISGNSAYDQYVYKNNEQGMNPSQLRGMDLFFSDRTNCSSCHSGFNFSSYAFENNGLYEVYADQGRFQLTGLTEDSEKFKVPSLRNVGLTAPYMHDGSIGSLEDVVQHYNQGGAINANKSPLIEPLNLTVEEQADLVSFLESLSDYEFINNTSYLP